MAIALGSHAVAASAAFSPVTSLSTSGVVTSASGSTFVIFVEANQTISSTTPVSDSKGNTYTQKATVTIDFGSLFCYVYVCDNGTGGSGHTATANLSASGGVSMFFTEITGAANPSVDVSNTFLDNAGASSHAGASVTITNAIDLILSYMVLGNNDTINDTSGWNALIDKSNPSNTSGVQTAANSDLITSATGSYHDTYTFGGSNVTGGLAIAFKAAGGAATFPPVPGSPWVLPGFQQHNALMVN